LTKVLSIDTDNQDMKTIVLMNAGIGDKNKTLVNGFLASRNLQGETAAWPPAGDGQVPSVRDMLSYLKPGDLLIFSDVTLLGNKFSAVMGELSCLFEHGISLGIVDTDTLIDAQGMKGREYARMIAFIAELFRKINSKKTKTALNAAKEHGKKLGRPSGLSRLDGKEIEICEYLDKRVSKSAIARILGTSRANLAQFIVARELGNKELRTGGSLHGRE
jgi:DNA invertase Pin-like site-specific DNA recombinase